MDTKEILKKYKTIAVVGCSQNPVKTAYQIPRYMKEQRYRIVPINLGADEIFGEKTYKSLLDLPEELKKEIEIVNIFRPPGGGTPGCRPGNSIEEGIWSP